MAKPRIYSKDFKYVPANKTDIRKTFQRARREQKCSSTTAEVRAVPTVKLKSA